MRRLALLAASWLLVAAAPAVEFVPLAPSFAPAADEYRRIWQAEGGRIAAALERAAGIPFPAGAIEAIVSDGPPMASYDGRTMRLRARYSAEYKRATLVHELGHLLALSLPRSEGLDDHRLLYLFLYDAWTELYGEDFARRMAGMERRIPGAYDYAAAWDWALAMSREERRQRLRALLAAGAGRPSLPIDTAGLFRGWDGGKDPA